MARSVDQIVEAMQDDINDVDPAIDTQAGPIRDLFIDPCATRVQENEESAEHVGLLYSAAFATLGTDAEIEAFTSNYGIGKDLGAAASATQYFCRYARPVAGQTLPIPQGTIVSTTDGYAFRTTASVSIIGDNADSYYNPTSSCYEISVKVTAVAVGADFNVSAYTIVSMTDRIDGIDKTENRTAATGGTLSEDNVDVIFRAQSRMIGTSRGTYGGVLTTVMQYAPTRMKDASLVFPTDWPIFKRRTHRPALDVYVIGSTEESTTYSYTSSLGGEAEITPDKQPVMGITGVAVNGIATIFTFVEDTNPATQGSTRALSHALLATPLSASDIVVVTYTYNELLYGLQNDLYAAEETDLSRTSLFGTDVLIRGSIRVAITVSVYVRALSSYDPLSVQADVESIVASFVETETFLGVLRPATLQYQIETEVVGVSTATIKKFTKTIGSLSTIETIEFNVNEEAYVDSTTT